MRTRSNIVDLAIPAAIIALLALSLSASATSAPGRFVEHKGRIHDQSFKPNPAVLQLRDFLSGDNEHALRALTVRDRVGLVIRVGTWPVVATSVSVPLTSAAGICTAMITGHDGSGSTVRFLVP